MKDAIKKMKGKAMVKKEVNKLKWLVLLKNLRGFIQCGRGFNKLLIWKVAASYRKEVEEVLF